MIPIPIIAGAAVLFGGGCYLLSRGRESAPSGSSADSPEVRAAKAVKQSGAVVGAAQQEALSETRLSGADEDYNMARENYRMIAGVYPPSSWTLSMIESWIAEQRKKNDAIKQYVELVSANSEYTQQQDTSEMTYSDLLALISSTQNTIDAGRERTRKEELQSKALQLATAFRTTLEKPNYNNLALKAQNAWDEATLQAMLDLDDEGKSWCEYYFRQAGPVLLPGYFNQAKKAWKNHSSISDCIIDSNTNTGRRGSDKASEVKKAYASVSPAAGNASGTRVVRKSVTDRIIRFNLQ